MPMNCPKCNKPMRVAKYVGYYLCDDCDVCIRMTPENSMM